MIAAILLQLFGLAPVLSMSPITKDLLTPIAHYGEGCGYASCAVMVQNVLNVHIVPSMHGELGYTRDFYEHYTGYERKSDHSVVNMKNILDNIITALWANDKRKFTFSDMPYLFHWWKDRDITVRRMVYQLLRQGRLYFVGGGWSMSDEATTSYHAIIDHFTYSLRKINATFLDCGRPLVTWQADVFGHSKEFASLMAQMGFDGHFINPISFDDELARMRSKTLEFVWRGSDDLGSETDIYTHKLFDGYWTPPGFCFGSFCDDPLIITSDSMFANVEERVELFMKQMLQRQSPYYTTKHVMVMMGQRFGYHDAALWFGNIDKLIMHVNGRQRNQKHKMFLFYSTPPCYLRAVHEAAPKLTTKQGDFFPFTYDKDTHGSGAFTSRPVIKYIARETHLLTQIAKHLQIFGQLGNNDQKFEEIMWIHGVLQDHTIITGASRPHVMKYYAKKAYLAKQLCLHIYRQALNNLRNSPKQMIYYACQFNMSSCLNIQGENFFIVIYNPLGWAVTIPVRLPVSKGLFDVFDPKGVKQNHSIIAIPDIVRTLPGRGILPTRDELVFIAENIPPMGYISYFVNRLILKTRYKRSVTKKKKYFTRQANNLDSGDKSILADVPEYEYFEETTKIPDNASTTWELKQYGDDGMTPERTSSVAYEEVEDIMGLFNMPKPITTRTTVKTTTPRPTTPLPTRTSTTTATTTRTTTTPTTTTSTTTTTTTTPTPLISTTVPPPVLTTQQPDPVTTETSPRPEFEYYFDHLSKPTVSTTASSDPEMFYRRMEQPGYLSSASADNYIKNEYIQINFNENRKLLNITLSNAVSISFDAQLCYYVSDDPVKLGTGKKKPGGYIFRPMDQYPILIADYIETKVLKTDIVQEMHIKFSKYAGLAFKLYKGLPTIEVDWVVGPIPDEDGLGKDVFVRYVTDLNNQGVFFTDSNGRQTIKRIRDVKTSYHQVLETGVAGIARNFYPVTSKLYIEDLKKNIRLSVFTDRAQGGTSLLDGHVDMMLHRRIFTDDIGIRASINETEYGKGLIVRGKHHLYVSKADYRPNKVFEKKFAKELELAPTVFTSIHESYYNFIYEEWRKENNQYSALKTRLPVGVHILTLEKWNDQLLIRLENYLEKSDIVHSAHKTVFIQELFRDFKIIGAQETTLSANVWLQDHVPLKWHSEKFLKNFNDVYGNLSNLEFSADQGGFKSKGVFYLDQGIELKPQEIRTFVLSYQRR